MLAQEKSVNEFSTLEELVEFDQQFPMPTNKAYFDRSIISSHCENLAADAINFLSDYFFTRTGLSLLVNAEYEICIFTKNKIQNDYGLEERDSFTDINTIVFFYNIFSKTSFLMSYDTTSEMCAISFQKDYRFDPLDLLIQNKKEFFGSIEKTTYYTLAMATVIYNYLQDGVLDLEIGVGSIKTH